MASSNNETVLLSIELTNQLNNYEEIIRRVATNYNTGERDSRLRTCNELDSKIKDIRQNYIREIRDIPNGTERAAFVQDLKEQMDRYKRLRAQYDEKAYAIDREGLEMKHQKSQEVLTNEQQMAAATEIGNKLQDKTEDAIGNMVNLVAEAEEIGIAADQKLAEQNEQLERIGQGYSSITNQTKRAKKETKKMATALCRDKFIMGMLLLNIVLLVTIILISVLWKTDKAVSQTTKEPTMAPTLDPTGDPLAGDPSSTSPIVFASRLRGGFISPYYDGDGFDPITVAPPEPRYDASIVRVGFTEGIERYIYCAGGNENVWSALNIKLPFALRGAPFGAVDFSHFVEDGEGYVCHHPRRPITEEFGGWRRMVKSRSMIDWK